MSMIDQIFNVGMGAALIGLSLLVVKLYFDLGKRVIYPINWGHAEVWFAHGIMTAFLATAINTAYFKFFWRMANYGWFGWSKPSYDVGNYFNYVTLTVMTWAAFCHLYSAYLNLSISERAKWTWITIAFYPKYNPIVRLIHTVLRRQKETENE